MSSITPNPPEGPRHPDYPRAPEEPYIPYIHQSLSSRAFWSKPQWIMWAQQTITFMPPFGSTVQEILFITETGQSRGKAVFEYAFLTWFIVDVEWEGWVQGNTEWED